MEGHLKSTVINFFNIGKQITIRKENNMLNHNLFCPPPSHISSPCLSLLNRFDKSGILKKNVFMHLQLQT